LILAFELLRLPAVLLCNYITDVSGRVPWVGTVVAVVVCLFVLVLALVITLVARWTRAPGETEKKRGHD
jgi:membrane protein YdbS with pleckstrin-like domain